ncbi:ABC transporter, putative [Ixodes scapularis]|uniref:ABC transporter, putative n=1 Tax=Ixodes scapularis TaxID=6945 RepID=B7PY14_IXOSC|nr:ABC transporter, putative [Ixodes scapularis]|eukprot:XP_002402302.1 ABC transporter, putative [Ixodes scapularis]
MGSIDLKKGQSFDLRQFKITRLSPTSRSDNPPGYVVAVMAMDCMQLSINLVQFTDPIVGMTCMPIVFYLLATRVGTVPALCCAAWLLAAILLPFPTSRLQNAIWGRVMRFRDDRVKRLTDLLTSVRLVKMCAWEDAYMHAVKELRAKEMVPLFLANLLDGFIDSVYSASGSVMIIILFGTLAALDPTRTLTKAAILNSDGSTRRAPNLGGGQFGGSTVVKTDGFDGAQYQARREQIYLSPP